MGDGTKWLLLSMLISLSAGNVCRNSGDCSCQWIDIFMWEIQCPSDSNPKFIARLRFNSAEANLQVKCYDITSWSEFGYRSSVPSSRQRQTNLTIERCPLPDESFHNITKRLGFNSPIYLTFASHMNLSSTLTRQHLSMLSALNRLHLSSNGLTELPSDLFRDLGTLEVLDLSSNKITTLPRDIFHGLAKLQKIDFSYNAMKFVDWKLFGNCTNLNELSLRGNLLTSLDYWPFRDLNHSYVFDLAENLLETLPPDAFEYANRLQLDISGNRFSTLPERLFPHTELTEITVCDNSGNLTTLPMDFLNHLSELENVTLIRNNLTSLPENIFWGSFSVQRIDLRGNVLSTLPENIFRDSSRLTYLDLSDNDLSYVPEGLFRALTNLLVLNLAGNSIASLSQNIFGNLTSLLNLNLASNNITDIYRVTFRELANIQLIRLSHNSLGLSKFQISRKYFYGSTIQAIFLDHNNLTGPFQITAVDSGKPDNLRLVDLSYNQISHFQVYSPFMGSHYLEYDLRHNNLGDISIYNWIPSKMNILIDDNPLDCGCKIYDMFKYIKEIREPGSGKNLDIILGNASCSEPDGMKGIPVASLRLESFTCHLNFDDHMLRCAEGCDCTWRPYDKTRIVNCSSRNLQKKPDEIIGLHLGDNGSGILLLGSFVTKQTRLFDWRTTRVELDLANNSLTEILTLNGTGYEYVERLILSHNNILKLSFDTLPPRLETLHLDHNDLKNFDRVASNAIIKSTTLWKLNIKGNPLSCDSDTRRALDSMEEKLGPNLRYSVRTCLDFRNPPNTKKAPATHISYTVF